MTRLSRARILCLALGALSALAPAIACQRPGGGISPEREGEGILLHAPKKPFEAFLESVPSTDRQRRDATLWSQLQRFYRSRSFTPAWTAPGIASPRASELLLALEQASGEGLDPSNYPVGGLAARLDRIDRRGPVPEEETFGLDLALSHAFLRYGTDLARGRLGPGGTEPGWHITPRAVELVPALDRATTREDPRAVLQGLAPKHPAYTRLRAALPHYREIVKTGGWRSVPEGVTLHPGETAPAARLQALASRLEREGFLATESGSEGGRSGRYDARLADGVKAFQRRHGLEPDGVIGAQTLAALNVPAPTRLRQIELNMERWRRMPENPGARFILVNVPGFRLESFENERLAARMKVIVGMEGWGTPNFRADMQHIVLHPAWRVPTSIATREILPKLRRDPGYLAANHMDVLSLHDGGTVGASSITWSKVSARSFPYRLRQRPGADNPLGRFKFVLPNDYDVYLHDTAAPRLFAKDKRAFSHGCIRVERPMDLALWLLATDPSWSRERLEEALKDPKTRRVDLAQDVPVYVTYWTAAVNEDGSIDFFADLYGMDEALEARMRARRR